ncbi:MAG: DNA methyltransferase, partial [archaeon]|nr:DNA methyltransferase [archaeon]
SVSHGTMLLKKMKLDGEFSYPKSIFLIEDIIRILADKDSIILDFHAGSGTTAEAVLNLNRQDNGERRFILIEQMDYIESVTSKRIQKVIENISKEKNLNNYNKEHSFIYCELKQWNDLFREKVMKAKNSKELIKIWEEMKERAFLSYKLDISKFESNKKGFEELSLENQKKFLIESLDMNQLYINLSEIDDKVYEVSKEDKELNKKFQGEL